MTGRESRQSLPAMILELSPVSPQAVDIFRLHFVKLLEGVNERIAIEARYCCDRLVEERLGFLREAHLFFGRTLIAIEQFSLHQRLPDEFSWLVSSVKHRGLGRAYLETMLKAWLASLHGILEPSFARELAPPVEFLLRNLSNFLEQDDPLPELLDERQRNLLKFLLDKKRRDANEYVLSLHRQGIPPQELCVGCVMPCLRHIGSLWQRNEISVTDEHAAAEICRYLILRLCDEIPRGEPLLYTASVSCVHGEEHSLAAEFLSAYLESQGWRVYFTGRSAPTEDIARAASSAKPDIVFLSVSLIANLPATMDLLVQIRKKAADSKVILGGPAAVLARQKLEALADIIIDEVGEGHVAALNLLSRHA